jgi:hypothetical protein
MGCVRCEKNAKKWMIQKLVPPREVKIKERENARPGSLVHPVSLENAIGCR